MRKSRRTLQPRRPHPLSNVTEWDKLVEQIWILVITAKQIGFYMFYMLEILKYVFGVFTSNLTWFLIRYCDFLKSHLVLTTKTVFGFWKTVFGVFINILSIKRLSYGFQIIWFLIIKFDFVSKPVCGFQNANTYFKIHIWF